MRALCSSLAMALVVLFAGSVLSACGAVPERPTPAGSFTLEQARQFGEFPLYYAGERASGLPLVAVVRRNDTANYVSFVYGDCAIGGLEQGCAPPAEIQVWPADARNSGSYVASSAGAPVPEKTAIRGVRAAFLGDGHLEVYTERSTVVIFSGTRARVLEIASALRCLAAVRAIEVVGTLDC